MILVVGDSLSAEYGLKPGDGWVALLQKRLAEQSAGLMDPKAFMDPKTFMDPKAFSPEVWAQFMSQAPMMQGLMGNYLEQSKNLFMQMQEQMQKQTEQMLGAFGIKR